jgi:trimeric autotransporter adhesin
MSTSILYAPRRFALGPALLLLLALLHPAGARAQAGETLHACFVPGSGTVYRIAAPGLPAECLASEHVRFSWSTLGSAGGDLSGSFPNPVVAHLQGRPMASTAPAEGQVLRFDGTAWAPAAPPPGGGGGVTAHGQLSGLTSDDHPQYLLADGVRASTDGFAVTLSPRSGPASLPATGAGVRLMWSSTSAAFRAGRVQGTQWDNVGFASVALGENTTASGDRSAALGGETTASGTLSTAMGEKTVASGSRSTAMGFESTASGFASTAMGSRTTASGLNSTAMGSVTAASGLNSTAMGSNTTASADRSTAMGGQTTASGDHSTAMGNRTIASGGSSTAMGFASTASGTSSMATGNSTVASGSNSTAMGNSTRASGANATAMGRFASTSGQFGAFVYGDGSVEDSVKATRANQFVVRAQHVWLGTNNSVSNPAGHFLTTSTGAHLTTGGAWTNSSDASRKEAFEAVDADEVLERLVRLPIRSWRYRDEAGARHLGPTAQDFHAAFGLGAGETAIATVDADGVAMLAVQALERRTRELREEARRAEALERRVAELEAGNEELRRRLERLEAGSGR